MRIIIKPSFGRTYEKKRRYHERLLYFGYKTHRKNFGLFKENMVMETTSNKVKEQAYMTIMELSAFINVKEKTLYQWAAMRQIPCFKLRGCLRFDIEEIKEWIKTCKIEPISGKTKGGKLLNCKSKKEVFS